MVSKTLIVVLIGLLGMVYQATQLPPPNSIDDPPVTSPRIRLSDGRYLAYTERGVPKNQSNYRIVIVHGFGSSKDMNFPATQVLTQTLFQPLDLISQVLRDVMNFTMNLTVVSLQELIEELGIYFLLYDRAGYGDSDPNPRLSVKRVAFDILEIADQLNLGAKFYLIGVSMGSYPTWSCLKYIPHRQNIEQFIADKLMIFS